MDHPVLTLWLCRSTGHCCTWRQRDRIPRRSYRRGSGLWGNVITRLGICDSRVCVNQGASLRSTLLEWAGKCKFAPWFTHTSRQGSHAWWLHNCTLYNIWAPLKTQLTIHHGHCGCRAHGQGGEEKANGDEWGTASRHHIWARYGAWKIHMTQIHWNHFLARVSRIPHQRKGRRLNQDEPLTHWTKNKSRFQWALTKGGRQNNIRCQLRFLQPSLQFTSVVKFVHQAQTHM